MRLSANARAGVTFVAGLAIGAGATLGAVRVSELELGDPLSGVTIVDARRPVVLAPTQAVARLRSVTGERWGLALRQDRGAYFGGKPLKSDEGFIRRLSERVTVPPPGPSRLDGVMTNALDEDSRQANGTLYVLWFKQSPDAQKWLLSDSQIFTQAREEGERTVYQAGPLVVYYAKPAGGRDWTPQIKQWVAEVAQCPMDANPCTLPEG